MTDSVKVEIVCGEAAAREPASGMDRANEACRAPAKVSSRRTFWTALENKPISRVSGVFQKKRGVRSGVPDVFVLYRGKSIFLELKSRRGVASKAQKQIRLEMLPAGAVWWMARSARAALMALHLSGVVFQRRWKPPQLRPWEGPFADPTRRLPQAPDVAAQRRAARQRWRSRQPHARETSNVAKTRCRFTQRTA